MSDVSSFVLILILVLRLYYLISEIDVHRS